MKTGKKLLCTLLVMLLVFASAPITGLVGLDLGTTANAVGEVETSGQCGDNAYWSFDTESGTLTVSGTGDMWDEELGFGTEDKDSYLDSPLKSLVVENGITSIGAKSFYYCTQLTSVVLPDSVTKIGESAFNNCTLLNSVNIPKNTSYIGKEAFTDCIFVEKIEIPAAVTSIGDNAFCRCISLKSITVDANNAYYSSDSRGVLFDKAKASLIQYPAGNEEAAYTVPSSVLSIEAWAFGYAMYLKDVALPEGLIQICSYAFNGCISLGSINLPNSLEKIGSEVFLFCLGLTELTLPQNLEYIGNAVALNCFYLDKIYIKSMDAVIDPFPMGLSTSCVEGISQDECIELFIKYFRTGDETVNNYLKEFPDGDYVYATIYCHPGSTAEENSKWIGVPYVTTHFFEGEWTYDYDNSVRYRKCTLCDERETESIAKPDTNPTDKPSENPGDNTGDNNTEEKTDFFSKIIAFFKSIFEKIKSWFK